MPRRTRPRSSRREQHTQLTRSDDVQRVELVGKLEHLPRRRFLVVHGHRQTMSPWAPVALLRCSIWCWQRSRLRQHRRQHFLSGSIAVCTALDDADEAGAKLVAYSSYLASSKTGLMTPPFGTMKVAHGPLRAR